jgi:flagellar motor protein MotB/tetratricopeptide (TPR) repeat protein
VKSIPHILCLLFMAVGISVKAQPRYSTTSKKAIRHLEDGIESYNKRVDLEKMGQKKEADAQGEKALQSFSKALQADSAFWEAYILSGELLLDMKKTSEAADRFRIITQRNPGFFPNAFFSLGIAYNQLLRYKEAEIALTRFLSSEIADSQIKGRARRSLACARFGAKAIEHPVPFSPKNLGPNINSKHEEYLPSLTADLSTLIFTVRQPDDSLSPVLAQKMHEDFYNSKKENGNWSPRKNLGPPVNTAGNEGGQSISADGQILIFTGCEEMPGQYAGGRKGLGSCDLFVSFRKGNGWSQAQNLGKTINSPAWDTQPSLSADGSTLYFVSKRAGGKGGSDLYCSTLTPNGEWATPVNLSDSINTPYDELSPFIHPDNQTLYFASNGHPGMGGMDLFVTRRKSDGTWSKPVNLGYPINTPEEETSLAVSALGTEAFYAANRKEGYGSLDIYSFTLYPDVRPVPTSYVKGHVKDAETGKPLASELTLIDLSSGKKIAETSSNPSDGEFLVCLPSGKSYAFNVSLPGYLFYSGHFDLPSGETLDAYQQDVMLQPIRAGKSVILENIFFETGSFQLSASSLYELNRLVELLNKNPNLKLKVSGHTDNVGDAKANLALSENRAKSVVTYLESKGVARERLKSTGYGNTKPIAPNDTESGRKKNRRTEFTVL